MKCPYCGNTKVELYGASYGFGPPSFKCFACYPYGRQFFDDSKEAYERSNAARGSSVSYANNIRKVSA